MMTNLSGYLLLLSPPFCAFFFFLEGLRQVSEGDMCLHDFYRHKIQSRVNCYRLVSRAGLSAHAAPVTCTWQHDLVTAHHTAARGADISEVSEERLMGPKLDYDVIFLD